MQSLRSVCNRIVRRKWLIISWLAIFGTLALLSLTVGNTINPHNPIIVAELEHPSFIRYFNRFLWSPLSRKGFLPWDDGSPFTITIVLRWMYLIVGLLWWSFLSSAIVYACNRLLKKVNVWNIKSYYKATILLYSAILISISLSLIVISIRNYEPKIDGSLANYINRDKIVPIKISLLYYEFLEVGELNIIDINLVTAAVKNMGGTVNEIQDNTPYWAAIFVELPGTQLRTLAQTKQITKIYLYRG